MAGSEISIADKPTGRFRPVASRRVASSRVSYHDRGEEPVHRTVGEDALKSPPSKPQKAASVGGDHALDLSEVRGLLRCAILVSIGVVACSLVIGACWGAWRGELGSIRDSLMIAGFLLLISWIATLLIVAAVSIPEARDLVVPPCRDPVVPQAECRRRRGRRVAGWPDLNPSSVPTISEMPNPERATRNGHIGTRDGDTVFGDECRSRERSVVRMAKIARSRLLKRIVAGRSSSNWPPTSASHFGSIRPVSGESRRETMIMGSPAGVAAPTSVGQSPGSPRRGGPPGHRSPSDAAPRIDSGTASTSPPGG